MVHQLFVTALFSEAEKVKGFLMDRRSMNCIVSSPNFPAYRLNINGLIFNS
jgi:hypothetical protein